MNTRLGCTIGHAETGAVTGWGSGLQWSANHRSGQQRIKERYLHVQHLMSRSVAGIQLQVLFAGLAAYALRWAMPWLQKCTAQASAKWEQTLGHSQHLVRIAANTTATIQQTSQGTALQFAPTSALPNVILFLKGGPTFQLPLGLHSPVQNPN